MRADVRFVFVYVHVNVHVQQHGGQPGRLSVVLLSSPDSTGASDTICQSIFHNNCQTLLMMYEQGDKSSPPGISGTAVCVFV